MDIFSFLPYICIFIVLASWFFGKKIRSITNTIIPFMEPVSYGLVILTCILMANVDFELILPIIVSFWVGYLVGYVFLGDVKSEWVGDHDIEGAAQNIREVVYYEENGRLFLQPQSFWDVCKHLFFGVKWPLTMPINAIYRRRHVAFHGRFFKLQADTVDMIDHERIPIYHDCFKIGTYKLDRNGNNRYGDDSIIGKPRYLFHFKAYHDIYRIAPYNTDAPYDFIRKTSIYKKAIKELADAKLENIDLEIEKVLRTTEGGAIMLSKLVKLTPEDLYMSPLVDEIENVIKKENKPNPSVKNSYIHEEED